MARNNAHRWANPALSKAMQELRRSNAAQPHVPLPQKGTRRQNDRRAIRDQIQGLE